MNARPELLDTYCKAGGATRGYQRAGFRVTGVDIEPQPRYVGEEFIQADALKVLADREFLSRFDAIHASPPCQRYSEATRSENRANHPDLLGPTRDVLNATGLPWVIENVPGAPMRADYKLCGCMFNLPRLKRERWFETSWHAFDLRPSCSHREPIITVAGTGAGNQHSRAAHHGFADWRRAMGIGWMTGKELAQAIPPAYTEYIGGALLGHLAAAAAP